MFALPKLFLAAAILTLGNFGGVVQAQESGDKPEVKDAPIRFRLHDGTIAIFGNDGMEQMLTHFNALMAKRQPGLRFAMTLNGSSTGLPALASGATLLAPLARDAWRNELAAFRQVHGYDATPIRIGYSGWGPRPNGKTPPAIYVSDQSPLREISLADLRRVFTTGNATGDISFWSQLGIVGAAGKRQIHLYGLADEGGSATAFRSRMLGNQPYATRYEPIESNPEIIRAVAVDPYAIGITGWVDAAKVSDKVRIVAIKSDTGDAALPAREHVAAGHYPLSLPVQFYVNQVPGRRIDPLAKAYLEVALSDEGQAIIARESDGPDGYLPLSPEDLSIERAKLAKM